MGPILRLVGESQISHLSIALQRDEYLEKVLLVEWEKVGRDMSSMPRWMEILSGS